MKHNRGRLFRTVRTLLTAIVIVWVIASIALYNGIVVRKYSFASDKMMPGETVRIALLTDLHSTLHGGDLSPLIDLVKAQSPDLICMVGDMSDGRNAIYATELLLRGLDGVAPMYYVLGNHEEWNDWEAILAVYEAYDVRVLRGEVVQLTVRGQTLQIAGIDDPEFHDRAPIDTLLEGLDGAWSPDTLTILLSHRPEGMKDYVRRGFDLVLAGHAHGGQVRIPLLLNGLYAPNQGWFPKYAGGLYHEGNTRMAVSRGLSIYEQLPRVFNPPELVIVDIMHGGNEGGNA